MTKTVPLKRKKISSLTRTQSRSLIEAYCIEYGEEHRKPIIVAVNFLKDLLEKTPVPCYPRNYIVEKLQELVKED